MYQECPTCNGSGVDRKSIVINAPAKKCDVCNGKKIISTINGQPPKD